MSDDKKPAMTPEQAEADEMRKKHAFRGLGSPAGDGVKDLSGNVSKQTGEQGVDLDAAAVAFDKMSEEDKTELLKMEETADEVAEEADNAERDAKLAAFIEKLEDKMDSFIEENDYYYLQEEDKFIRRSVMPSGGKGWVYVEPESLTRAHRVDLNGSYTTGYKENGSAETSSLVGLFSDRLEAIGRSYLTETYTNKPCDDKTLNKLRRDDWIKPFDDGAPHHKMFDVLMTSLGGGKHENIDHLEHCTAYKILHPEDHLIPCPVINGDGGNGKNVFTDDVLRAVFGGATISTKGGEITGNFQEIMMGMEVVLINELEQHKAQMDRMKGTIGQEFLDVGRKHRKTIQVENTPWWMIGTQDPASAIKLGGDESDRRWSIITIPQRKTLVYWVKEMLGVSKVAEDGTRSEEWNALFKVLKDPEEIGRWLHHLVETYGHRGCPMALQGQDFRTLMAIQQDLWEDVCYEVFIQDEPFTFIKWKDLWKLIRQRYQVEEGKLPPFNKKWLKPRITKWLAQNNLDVVCKTREGMGMQTLRVRNDSRSTAEGWVAQEHQHEVIDATDNHYHQWFALIETGNGDERWVEDRLTPVGQVRSAIITNDKEHHTFRKGRVVSYNKE